ncbi:MAG: methionyl-tRNA formyltransferase [Ilumatobacteraceae bacterium]
MDLVYLGTPEVATLPLRALVAAGHRVRLVVTGPPRRRGRRASLSPSPVESTARELDLPVAYDLDSLDGITAELGVVVAFGRLIPASLLDRLPMVNLHFSDLPRWRGAAPVERAILSGDSTTAVCLMALDAGLDTGPVHARARVEIGDLDADRLMMSLGHLGADLLVEQLSVGLGAPEPQTGEATYAEKITREDLRIDWSADPAVALRQIRVGGAWTTWRGTMVKVLEAHLVDEVLRPGIVRPEGRGDIEFDAWWRGARPAHGEWFV